MAEPGDARYVELGRVLFRFVAFHMLLHAPDQGFSEILEGDGLVSDLAQGHHGILVIIPLNGESRSRGDVACPLGSQHHQIEAIWDFKHTIFDSNARHRANAPVFLENRAFYEGDRNI